MVKNSLYLLSSEALARILSIGVTAILARRLGVTDFGVFSLALAVAMLAGIAMDFGLHFHGVREIAKAPNRAPMLIGTTLLIKFFLTAVLTLAVVLALRWSRADASLESAIRNLCLWIGILTLGHSFRMLFRGLERMDLEAGVILADAFFKSGLVLAAALFADLETVTLAFALSAGFTYLLSSGLAHRRFLRQPVAASIPELLPILRASSPMLASLLLLSAFYSTTFFLVALWLAGYQTGLYAAADKVYKLMYLPPLVLCQAAYPRLAALPDGPELDNLVRRLYTLTFAAMVPISTGLVLFAPEVLGLLFGPDYLPAATALRLLAAAGIGIPAMYAGLHLQNARHGAGRASLAMAGATLLLLFLNWIFTQNLFIRGAALAELSAMSLLALTFLHFARRYFTSPAAFDRLVTRLLILGLPIPLAGLGYSFGAWRPVLWLAGLAWNFFALSRFEQDLFDSLFARARRLFSPAFESDKKDVAVH